MSKKKHKHRKSRKSHTPQVSKNLKSVVGAIKKAYYRKGNEPMNYKQLTAAIGAHKSEADTIRDIVGKLYGDGVFIAVSRGKYQLASFNNQAQTGVFMATRRGTGYVNTGEGEDIFIDERNTNKALDGDEVEVVVTGSKSGQPAGKVTRIIARKNNTFVGIIEISERFAFVVPSNQKVPVDIFVSKNSIKSARNGQKVLVELIDWPDGAENPTGKVIEVLGNPGEHNVEMHAILAEFGLPLEFPDNVLQAADKVDTTISAEEIKRRRDFRKITTFTIDPDDAKDFDDALSVEFLDNGNIRVGVHIADVTHYVRPGSILDVEAINRATSVYLVDRVVPMLPEVLSNMVCSLRPDEDSLCFSAVFELDQKAKVVDEWFGKTVIHSNHRFTYDTALKVLEEGKGPYLKELQSLLKLSKIMRRDRISHGAIEFGGSEVKFQLDEDGKPVGVIKKVMKDTNRLIEDFMLLANKRVAARVAKVKDRTPRPFVYRVHDVPDPDKLIELKAFARRFGHNLTSVKDKGAAFAITQLLRDAAGQPEEDVIRHMAIRTMSKAYYTTKNIGHYGLSFTHYSHFTSPIRRYPDMLVHRQLEHELKNEKGMAEDELESLCRHCSVQEKKATEAERASIKYKQVEYMLDKVGEEFAGIISGITSWGIFVELVETNCEGMISLQSMRDDHYVFDEDKYQIIGKRHGEEFNIGDALDIRVVRGDLINKQLDFEFVKFR